jgi:hypothetical protein
VGGLGLVHLARDELQAVATPATPRRSPSRRKKKWRGSSMTPLPRHRRADAQKREPVMAKWCTTNPARANEDFCRLSLPARIPGGFRSLLPSLASISGAVP